MNKIKALLLVIVFTAGCTVVMYEHPDIRRARGLWERHWHNCPYTGLYGHIYWEYMWYRHYPYYSWVLYSHVSKTKPRAVQKISKHQLKKPESESTEKGVSTTTKVTKKPVEGTQVKTKGKKVKKKKDV